MDIAFLLIQYYMGNEFFFLISKNDIYTKGNSMHEEHSANRENTRKGKQRETKKKTKQNKKKSKRVPMPETNQKEFH